MMQDLAMQVLEILMNSIQAGARRIILTITDSVKQNLIRFVITDNGKGMDEAMIQKVTDPFTTTRTTRRVGMGVAFMKGLTEQCNGTFRITSKVGSGTTVEASVQKDNIDTPPMGDLGEMMMDCIQADESIEFELTYATDSKQFVFQSSEIKEQLAGVSLLEPSILLWIKEYINQGIDQAKEDAR
jgi:anti-sigma regulatory factor (Ser/Thr protein kinase)